MLIKFTTMSEEFTTHFKKDDITKVLSALDRLSFERAKSALHFAGKAIECHQNQSVFSIENGQIAALIGFIKQTSS